MIKIKSSFFLIASFLIGLFLIIASFFVDYTPILLSYDNNISPKTTQIIEKNIDRKNAPLRFNTLTLSGRNNTTGYYLNKFGFTLENQNNNTYLLFEKVQNTSNRVMNYQFTYNYTLQQNTTSNVLPYAIPFIICESTSNLVVSGSYGDQSLFGFAHLDIPFNFGSNFNIYVMGLYNNRYITSATNSDITINYSLENLNGYIAFGIVFAQNYQNSTYKGTSPYNYVTGSSESYETTEFIVQNGVYGYASFFDSYIQIYINESSSGSTAYQNGYENGYNIGRTDGYDEGYNTGYANGINDADNDFNFNWLTSLFESVDKLLSVEIFNGFKLWYLVAVPAIVALVFGVLKLFR